MSRLSRWSQRKLDDHEAPDHLASVDETQRTIGAGNEPEDVPSDRMYAPGHAAVPSPAQSPAQAQPTKAAEGDASESAAGTDATALPDPETLVPGSDIRAYLEPGIDKALKQRALRQLFSAERYGIRDGLDDYDDDFRQRLTPLAKETAQRLRRWWDNVDDATDDRTLDTDTDTDADSVGQDRADKEAGDQQAFDHGIAEKDAAGHAQDQATNEGGATPSRPRTGREASTAACSKSHCQTLSEDTARGDDQDLSGDTPQP
ncbi:MULTISPECIES: DUF3306 domain-containing protein [Halomonas]|uniref:DUF3306 domain-containing protein n=1 Tax=Halomonas TaxID=2745 RepID=UPI001C987AE2|nr:MULTISPECIES: DUF3306 domain-containing protein [Halomonas]MBY6207164.1 DUF3306 domain-containing protein [Halomonas sp. DP3Y7-2]MBY6229758.1 DUF3306 domain-containing protein [Halomonas sp. DP3Y7-1]MCA0917910.1 DUF3306 domain-containing protein [Halomonas denitrificans]